MTNFLLRASSNFHGMRALSFHPSCVTSQCTPFVIQRFVKFYGGESFRENDKGRRDWDYSFV